MVRCLINELLGGTICLGQARGHRDDQTKTKLRYKSGSVYFLTKLFSYSKFVVSKAASR